MQKIIFFICISFLFILYNLNSEEKNIIIDKDGKKIILYANKTWDYYIEEEKPKESNNLESKLKSELNGFLNKLTGKKTTQNTNENKTEINTKKNLNSNNDDSQNSNIEIQEFLKIHNDERKRLGIPPLEWDQDLTKQCEIYANKLLKLGTLKHDVLDGVGENLFWGSSSNPKQYKLKDGALSWLTEKKFFKSNKYTYETGHYTQMIWRNTQKVGAYIIYNEKECYIVARYFPPGNYSNQKVY